MDYFWGAIALVVLWIAACHWEVVFVFGKEGKKKIALAIWLTGLFLVILKFIK